MEIWQLGKSLSLRVYEATKHFPKEEAYGMTSQMRRAVLSIPSNIAEGFNRRHNREYKQFLYIALGSCGELETQLEIAFELGYLSKDQHAAVQLDLISESKMIRSLINKIDKVSA